MSTIIAENLVKQCGNGNTAVYAVQGMSFRTNSGVAMLSNVFNHHNATQVNIQTFRTNRRFGDSTYRI